MRLAVISDIHGNLEAFEAVLSDIDRSDIDRIVSLGDNIGYGPDPEAVIRLLRRRSIPSVVGNHEMVIQSLKYEKWFNQHVRETFHLTEERLSEKSKAHIRTMKRYRVEEGCRFVHGFPPKSPILYLFQASERKVKRVLDRRIGERLCFVGHTHELQMVGYDGCSLFYEFLFQGNLRLQSHYRYIISAGSVGQPRDGNNRAKYVIWDSETDVLEVRYVAYDIEKVVRKIKKAGYPDYFGERLR